MKVAEELWRFMAYAEKQQMDLSGDKKRFKHQKTAKAWTKWFEEAQAFYRKMKKDWK